ITEHGFEVTFRKDDAVVVNAKGEVTTTAKKRDGLYYVVQSSERSSYGRERSENEAVNMWHVRLGHINETYLKKMVEEGRIPGISPGTRIKISNCEVCAKGKMTATPFNHSSTRSEELLEIIHMDVAGPMRTKSLNGARYFVVFVDDKSRMSEIRFLREKGEAYEEFVSF